MSPKKSSTKTSKDIRNVSQANPSFQLSKKSKVQSGAKQRATQKSMGKKHQKFN
jgi:hypothetical protein